MGSFRRLQLVLAIAALFLAPGLAVEPPDHGMKLDEPLGSTSVQDTGPNGGLHGLLRAFHSRPRGGRIELNADLDERVGAGLRQPLLA